jgi:hypothetical protein
MNSAAGIEPVPPGAVQVRRALLSVSDKRGIADFARGLADLGIEIVSTGAPPASFAARASRCVRSTTSPASPKSSTVA